MSDKPYACQEIGDVQEWRGLVATLPVRPLYLSDSWGRYKTHEGWSIRRLAVFDPSERLIALLQVQDRRLSPFGGRLALVQGGPAFSTASPSGADIRAVQNVLTGTVAPGGFGLVVVQTAQVPNVELNSALSATGFCPVPASDADTVMLALSPDGDVMEKGLSRFWKRNLKKARAAGLEIRPLANSDARWEAAMQNIADMYAGLAERKGFGEALDPVRLGREFRDDPCLEVIEVYENGTPVAARAVYHGGACTLDLLAAATPRGHETAASYLAMWTLISSAARRGATHFDAGGIDPENNPGVYRFKAGLGGEEVEVGRLWVKGKPSLLTPFALRYLARGRNG